VATEDKIGDPNRFSAVDLQRIYMLNEPKGERIIGRVLNEVLRTQKYASKAWYMVLENGDIKKI
jgi:hypothetical protein